MSAQTEQADGARVLERLHALPGGEQLLQFTAGREDVELVGGCVRDLLRGREPRELDVILEGDAASFAKDLISTFVVNASRFEIDQHDRFGTVLVRWPGGRVDIARRRVESYAAPGALPDVSPGTPDEDLERRDFTINAIAVGLGGSLRGELRAVPDALEDLREGRLRVLHDASFRDDPTRLLRLARYSGRLGFEPEPNTARLAAEALATGALATVSGARIGAELRLALSEVDAPASLSEMHRLGVLAALQPPLTFNGELARASLRALPDDGQPGLLLLAGLLVRAPAEEDELRALLDELDFVAGARELALRSAVGAPELVGQLATASTASAIAEAARDVPAEGVALAAALAERQGEIQGARAAERWLQELRHVQLLINGDDLLNAGIAAGPEIGRRLEKALYAKLDGELAEGREAELAAALEGP